MKGYVARKMVDDKINRSSKKKDKKKKRSPKVHKSFRISQKNLDYLEKVNRLKMRAGKKYSVANALDDLISSARLHKKMPTLEVTEINLPPEVKALLIQYLDKIEKKTRIYGKTAKELGNNANQIAHRLNSNAEAIASYQDLKHIADVADASYDQLLDMREEIDGLCQLLSMYQATDQGRMH